MIMTTVTIKSYQKRYSHPPKENEEAQRPLHAASVSMKKCNICSLSYDEIEGSWKPYELRWNVIPLY